MKAPLEQTFKGLSQVQNSHINFHVYVTFKSPLSQSTPSPMRWQQHACKAIHEVCRAPTPTCILLTY